MLETANTPGLATLKSDDADVAIAKIDQLVAMGVSVKRACRDLAVPRSTYYWKKKNGPSPEPTGPNDQPPEEPKGVASRDDTRSSTTDTNETNEERE